MKNKEANARIKINKLLEDAGWRFFDDANGLANIQLEPNVKIKENIFNGFGENFEKSKNGYVDFLLLDNYGKPFIVLEAKKDTLDPLSIGKEQARQYARSLNVRYVILSNGDIHYFWDLEKGNPEIITRFPTLESLINKSNLKYDTEVLVNANVEQDYIARTIMPNYDQMPDYINENTRESFIKNNKLTFLRKYQINAVKSIQKSVKEGKTRFLFEMATGTGKTLTAAAIIKLFLRSSQAKRILFLVDRIELENQGEENFKKYLGNDYIVCKYKKHQDDWRKADVVVCTAQTLLINDKYSKIFRPTDFDLVISDEAHRSINGNARALFEYFIGYKLGLTATPKDYIKNVSDETKNKDPRGWEKRQILDTYRTFGCESGEPTYRYNLNDGVKDGFLISPYVIDARSEITTELLAEHGYAVTIINDELEEEEETFFQKDFEKRFFSDETNITFCKTFIEKAKRDPISQEIGKSIIFCVSRKHAAKITKHLNELIVKYYPNKYQSDFAVQVTSDIPNAQSFTNSFTSESNNLNGHTNFLDDYKSSKTRVCVTVGMMTTGYDCQDLLNVVLMRPIFSPSDFIQIKGRGTRKYNFEYQDLELYVEKKDKFYLHDFFGNVEYFEKDFNYDEKLKLPTKSKNGSDSIEKVELESFTNYEIDPIKTTHEFNVGVEGLRIDRELFAKFENIIQNDITAKQKFEDNLLDELIAYIDEQIMEKPNEFFTWEKLRKSINIDRRLSKKEILEKVFGAIKEFASKNELIEQEFQRFVLTHKKDINNNNILVFKKFFEAYLSSKDVQLIIEGNRLGDLYTCPEYGMEDFKELGLDNLKLIKEYIYDNVNVHRFAL